MDHAVDAIHATHATHATSAGNPDANPLLQDWDTPHGLPPFSRCAPRTSSRPSTRRWPTTAPSSTAIAAQTRRRRPSPTPWPRSTARAACCHAWTSLLQPAASATTPELQAVQRAMAAPHGGARAARSTCTPALFARIEPCTTQRQRSGSTPSSCGCSSGCTWTSCAPARASTGRTAAALCRSHAGAGRADHALRAERAARRVGLAAGAGPRPSWPGLPDFVRAAARQAAADRGLPRRTSITLSRSLIVPFLSFCERRDLREQAWRAWAAAANTPARTDNREVAREILRLRAEQARAARPCQLCRLRAGRHDGRHARRGAALLDDVWPRALAALERERQALLRADAGRRRTRRDRALGLALLGRAGAPARSFAIDDAEVKPYFALDRMVAAAFDCAQRLFGLHVHGARRHPGLPPRRARPTRCAMPTATCVGIFLQDNFARPTKRSGAWMSALRWQQHAARRRDAAGRS